MGTVIMQTTARVVAPLILLVSAVLFFQGHNLPGGGFIAGVLATVAVALLYIAFGMTVVEEGLLDLNPQTDVGAFENRVVVAYRRLFTLGLVITVVSGLLFVVIGGEPFLTQEFTYVEGVPLYGEVEVTSVLMFEVGVFCVVAGGLLTILSVVGLE